MATENEIVRGRIFQYLASVTGALTMMSFGINACWTSPFVTYLKSNSSIIPMTSNEVAWCIISPGIGGIIGAPIAAYFADKIGRKYTILMMAPPVFFSQLSIGYVRNVWVLFILRLIIGVADGACFTVVPMYIGEISAPKIRGFLSSLISFFFVLGVLLINTLGCFLSIFSCSIICASVPAIHFLGFIFMPESPYYYIKVNDIKAAKQALITLRNTVNVEEDLKVICDAVKLEEEMVKNTKFTDIFTVPSNRKAVSIYIILSLALAGCAKAPVLSYTKMIFEETGSSISSILSTIVFCTVELVVMIFTTYFIIDRFGKRYLTIISTAGCSITLFVMSAYFFAKDFDYDVKHYLNWLPLTSLSLYSILFSIGLSFTQICYLSELFPTNVKANALCSAEIFILFINSITVKIFQVTNDEFNSLSVSFLCFSVLCMIMLGFIVKYVPETKGMTLEEIQLFLKHK
ncbi:facilitated trehalose transporter Tret1 [Leptinotarsa decemlineata]|uniref:facilitated trehalose transporter Tret1 n=1 Tax=Leptinotarsa decemlineata TaxID=7539 RepID=UPI000C254A42|nr:facilitated trehalose transporter Tret1-like [Leptinotarsa decemlineata]XP_023022202.1 facilitated trehalose transporter Tret1-like [Leptinotarsa decemlineata]